MIDRATAPEKTGDAFVIGDIGRDRDGVQSGCNCIQAVNATGCKNNIGSFPLGEFGGRETDTGRAPDDDDFLTCEHDAVSFIFSFVVPALLNSSLRGALATKQSSLPVSLWIASRSLSSGALSRDPLARNDGRECCADMK
jgi:hypothetical protein